MLKLSSDGCVPLWGQLQYVVHPCQFVAPFSEPLLDVLELSLLRKLTEVQVAATTENAPEQLDLVRGAHKSNLHLYSYSLCEARFAPD